MELPRLQPLYEEYRDKGLEIIAVEGYRMEELAKKFIEEKGLTYTLVENGEEDTEIVGSIFKVRSFPSSFLIDRNGKVMYFHLGFEVGDEEHLEEEIKTLL